MTKIWQFASYNLLSSIYPAVGFEHLHCDMKRGFTKARKQEPNVKALLDRDSPPQAIGRFAQRGVYEFHQHFSTPQPPQTAREIAARIGLETQPAEVRERVQAALTRYCKKPILAQQQVLLLNSGDEGFPEPILIHHGDYLFNFYAAIDCIVTRRDGRLQIVDFKTGKSAFDRRQAYLYLLAARYLYPQRSALASFYNLETGKASPPIVASAGLLDHFQSLLAELAKHHQKQLRNYRKNPARFRYIFPPNPGAGCRYCPFLSICEFTREENPDA